MPRKTPVPEVPAFDDGTNLDFDGNIVPDLGPAFDAAENPGYGPDPDADAPIEGQFTEVPEPEKEQPPVPTPIRALVTTADQHLTVGMAAFANMDEGEFRANLALHKRALERVAIVQRELMTENVDYGRVPGVPKPFLFQPGAELLANLYGFAIRQEAVRIDRKIGDDPNSPPFAYHVRSYVHLGDTSGPIVAEGNGEANAYEEKWRYRYAAQGCPACGKSGTIITRKTPEALKGKKQCANFGNKDGCGTVFEPNDPRLAPATKEPQPDIDLYGLAETVLQIAAKRSMVASVRRATGTSGLFSQDDDSPSVQKQSADAGGGDPDAQAPVVETVTPTEVVGVGGRGTNVTAVQLERLPVVAKEKGLKGKDIAELVERLFGLTGIERSGAAAMAAVQKLTADQVGNLLAFIETGDLSSVGNEAE